mgnify:CR=1 FL=1
MVRSRLEKTVEALIDAWDKISYSMEHSEIDEIAESLDEYAGWIRDELEAKLKDRYSIAKVRIEFADKKHGKTIEGVALLYRTVETEYPTKTLYFIIREEHGKTKVTVIHYRKAKETTVEA